MDRSTAFLEDLILPRALAVVRGGALVADSTRLIFAEDLDGDLRADRRMEVDPVYAVGINLEHQPNGLLPALDNWIYNAKSNDRYRFREEKWVKEERELGSGEEGVDDVVGEGGGVEVEEGEGGEIWSVNARVRAQGRSMRRGGFCLAWRSSRPVRAYPRWRNRQH